MFIKDYVPTLFKIINVFESFYPTGYLPGKHRALRHLNSQKTKFRILAVANLFSADILKIYIGEAASRKSGNLGPIADDLVGEIRLFIS